MDLHVLHPLRTLGAEDLFLNFLTSVMIDAEMILFAGTSYVLKLRGAAGKVLLWEKKSLSLNV